MASQAAPLRKLGLMFTLLAGLSPLSACASSSADDREIGPEEAVDTLEPYNRAMFRFNTALDHVLLKPVTTGYRYVVPEEGRHAVSNVLDNAYTPVVFANSVLQGDPQNSFATLWRFVLNTTLGIGGIFDFASAAGLHNRPTDFGQTLGLYGVDSGAYVVLPIIGPSSVRDAVGRAGDIFMSPFAYTEWEVSLPVWGAMVLDTRSRNDKLIEDIYDTSLDPYSTFRSAYLQKRVSDIRRAKISREKALE